MRFASWRLLLASAVLCTFPVYANAEEKPEAPVPKLYRVKPNTVPMSRGASVTLLGDDFDLSGTQPVQVLIDGKPCTEVTVRSSRRITAAVPPSRGAGPVDVEVRQGVLQRVVLRDGLCYDDGKITAARWYRIRARLDSAWELLEQGGTIMLILVLLSVLGVAWAIHCAFVLRAGQVMPRKFLEKLSGHMSRGEVPQAIDACQSDGSVFARVALAALRKSGDEPRKIRETAQAAGSREGSHLLQKISYLSNIGVISPMLGLLGTVVGMIIAFNAIELGEAGPRHIEFAGAINKAMITTAAGLVIGIPAMACFYFFRGRLLRLMTEMEQVAEEMAEAVAVAGEEE